MGDVRDKKREKDGERGDFKVCGEMIIPCGGGATSHHLCVKRWCQQPIYTTGNPVDKLTHFLFTISIPLSSFLWKVAILKSMTCWKTLPLHLLKHVQWWCGLSSLVSCSQASFPLHQSPIPVRSIARTNQRSSEGVSSSVTQIKTQPTHCLGRRQACTETPSSFPPTPLLVFSVNQVYCLMFRAPDRSSDRSIMCSSLNPIQQVNSEWSGQPTWSFT